MFMKIPNDKKQFFFDILKSEGKFDPIEAVQYLKFMERFSFEKLKHRWVKR